MRVTLTPPIVPQRSSITRIQGRRSAVVLHEEEGWQLLDATNDRYNVGQRGWHSVIKHYCPNINGAPYWMLLEQHSTPTRCNYCDEEMPPSIVCLFKFQNMEVMR